MDKKIYIAPEMAEVIIPGKLMLSVVSEPAQEVLSRQRNGSFEHDDDDGTDGNVW